MKNRTKLSVVILALVAASSSSWANTKTGYFIDAPVTGLFYQTSSDIQGKTVKGAYEYNEGDVVTFYLGNDDNAMVIASVSAQEVITPTLSAVTPSRSVNMTRLLLSLDETPESRDEILLASKALSDPDFQKQLKNINLSALDAYKDDLDIDLVSVKEAAKHLTESQQYIKDNFTSDEVIFRPLNKVLVDDVVSRRDWKGELCFFDTARINEKDYHGPVGSLKYKLTLDGIHTYPSSGDYFGSNDGSVSGCNLNAAYRYTQAEFEKVSDYEEWGGILACAKTGCTRNDINGFNIENFDDEGDWKYRTTAINYDEKTGLIMQKTQGLGPSDKVPHLNRREFIWLSSENPKLRNINISGIWQLIDYKNPDDNRVTCLSVSDGQVMTTSRPSTLCPTDKKLYKQNVTAEFQDMWWLHSRKNTVSLAQLNTPVKWYSESGQARYTSWEYLPAGKNWDKGLLYRFEQQMALTTKGTQQMDTVGVAELKKIAD